MVHCHICVRAYSLSENHHCVALICLIHRTLTYHTTTTAWRLYSPERRVHADLYNGVLTRYPIGQRGANTTRTTTACIRKDAGAVPMSPHSLVVRTWTLPTRMRRRCYTIRWRWQARARAKSPLTRASLSRRMCVEARTSATRLVMSIVPAVHMHTAIMHAHGAIAIHPAIGTTRRAHTRRTILTRARRTHGRTVAAVAVRVMHKRRTKQSPMALSATAVCPWSNHCPLSLLSMTRCRAVVLRLASTVGGYRYMHMTWQLMQEQAPMSQVI